MPQTQTKNSIDLILDEYETELNKFQYAVNTLINAKGKNNYEEAKQFYKAAEKDFAIINRFVFNVIEENRNYSLLSEEQAKRFTNLNKKGDQIILKKADYIKEKI